MMHSRPHAHSDLDSNRILPGPSPSDDPVTHIDRGRKSDSHPGFNPEPSVNVIPTLTSTVTLRPEPTLDEMSHHNPQPDDDG